MCSQPATLLEKIHQACEIKGLQTADSQQCTLDPAAQQQLQWIPQEFKLLSIPQMNVCLQTTTQLSYVLNVRTNVKIESLCKKAWEIQTLQHKLHAPQLQGFEWHVYVMMSHFIVCLFFDFTAQCALYTTSPQAQTTMSPKHLFLLLQLQLQLITHTWLFSCGRMASRACSSQDFG